MQESSTGHPAEVAASGIKGLDDVLSGGFPRGHIYLVEGLSGTGKTTLGMQFVMNGASRGERVLYISLSESEADLRKGADSHGWDLSGVDFAELMAPEEILDPARADDIFDPGSLEMHELSQRIRDAVSAHRPQRLVLDSLANLRLLAADEVGHRRQMDFLRRFLERESCTSLLIDELIEQPGDPQPRSLVHGIISLEEVMMDYGSSRQRLRVTKMRGVHFPHTWHDYRILPGGLEVYPHLVAAEYHAEQAPGPAQTGVAGLDDLLNGGLQRGHSGLILGPPGSGKSTLLLHLLAAAAGRDERALCYVFNETVEALVARGERLGLALQRDADAGTLKFEKIDPNEVSPGEFAFRVRQQVEDHEAQIVVLDSMGGYMNAMPEQPFLALHFHELLTYLSRQGVVGLMSLSQPSPTGAESAGVDLCTLVDTVLVLRWNSTGEGLRPLLCVMKHRGGAHDSRFHELHFTNAGMAMGPARAELPNPLPGVVTSSSGGEKSG